MVDSTNKLPVVSKVKELPPRRKSARPRYAVTFATPSPTRQTSCLQQATRRTGNHICTTDHSVYLPNFLLVSCCCSQAIKGSHDHRLGGTCRATGRWLRSHRLTRGSYPEQKAAPYSVLPRQQAGKSARRLLSHSDRGSIGPYDPGEEQQTDRRRAPRCQTNRA